MAIAPLPGVHAAWAAWRRHGTLPYAGGWFDQPLSLLVQILAIDAVYSMLEIRDDKSRDANDMPRGGLSNMSITQIELGQWLGAF